MTIKARAVTLFSTPQACEVCGGRERVLIAFVRRPASGVKWAMSTVGPCFHCDFGWPVVHLPMRGGRP